MAAREATRNGLPELPCLSLAPDLLDLEAGQRVPLATRLIEEAIGALTAPPGSDREASR